MSDIRTFETLDVWKSARDFRNKIYEWAHQLPDQETYRLKDQIICASRAIGAILRRDTVGSITRKTSSFAARLVTRYTKPLITCMWAWIKNILGKWSLKNSKSRFLISMAYLTAIFPTSKSKGMPPMSNPATKYPWQKFISGFQTSRFFALIFGHFPISLLFLFTVFPLPGFPSFPLPIFTFSPLLPKRRQQCLN